KLNRPEFARAKTVVEIVSRVLVLSFGIFFATYITAPFVVDVVQFFQSGTIETVRGDITTTHSYFGAWFLQQSVFVHVAREPGQKSYTLLYSLHQLRPGDSYELSTLPRSGVVIDYRRILE